MPTDMVNAPTLRLSKEQFEKHKNLTESMQAKQKQWKELLESVATTDDLLKCETLKEEVKGLQGQIQVFNSVSAMKGDAQATEDFLTKPASGMPHVGSQDAPGTGQKELFNHIGSLQAGHTELQFLGTEVKVIDEIGAGTLGEKTWKLIQTDDYKKAFIHHLRRKGDLHWLDNTERKLLEEGADTEGGYTVPIDLLTNRIISRTPTPSRIAPMCSNMTTGREVVEMIKLNYSADNLYTTGFRVTNTGENPTGATQAQVNDTNLFGTIKIPVHTHMIRGLLSNNLAEDSAFGILNWLSEKFGETIDLFKDNKVINGSGKMEMYGLVTMVAGNAAGQGTDDPKISYVVSGDANTVTPDGVMNLALDVPEQYEDACKFYFNKVSGFKEIRKLKDLNDRYLFGQGVQDSGLSTSLKPKDLLGYPYVFSGWFPNVAAGNYPVFFGDLSGYQLVNRIGFSLQILRELYAETNALAMVGRIRVGGQVIMPWKLRACKISA